jgi:hypothetical protein
MGLEPACGVESFTTGACYEISGQMQPVELTVTVGYLPGEQDQRFHGGLVYLNPVTPLYFFPIPILNLIRLKVATILSAQHRKQCRITPAAAVPKAHRIWITDNSTLNILNVIMRPILT